MNITHLRITGAAVAAGALLTSLGLGLGPTTAMAQPTSTGPAATSTAAPGQAAEPLTVEVVSTDASSGTAVLRGTGVPGSAILLTHKDWHAVPTIVHLGDDVTWSGEVTDLRAGINQVEVWQFVPGQVGGPTHVAPLTIWP
jgi:hypothetical protein